MAFRLTVSTRLLPVAAAAGHIEREEERPVAAAAAGAAPAPTATSSAVVGDEACIEHGWLALGSLFNGRMQRLGPKRPSGLRLVLADPPEANTRLKNRKEIAAASAAAPGGCVLLLRRGGGSSFAAKAWRALEACPEAAAIVIGNDDREHPHAVFAMQGVWPPRPAPTPTAGAAAAAAATAKSSEVPSVPILMISHAAYREVSALLKLERDFSYPSSSSRLILHVRLEPLLTSLPRPGAQEQQQLSPFERGPAIRQAVRANDHQLLRALLLGHTEEEEEEEAAEEAAATEWKPGQGHAQVLAYTEPEERSGLTVLHIAVEWMAVECLGQLLQRPGIARILDAPNARGRRPTHLAAAAAAEQGRDLALALLLAAGAYVDAPDEALGWTPMHFAARAGALDALHVLLQAGAALDYRAQDGSTPFMVAVHCGQTAAAEALLAAGANPFLPNARGKRPVDCAHAECARLIHQYEQMAVSSGRPLSGDQPDFFHYSAAPWLSLPSGSGQWGVSLILLDDGEAPSKGKEDGEKPACSSASVPFSMLATRVEEARGACHAILPSALLEASLREDLMEEGASLLDGNDSDEGALQRRVRFFLEASADPTAAILRALSRAAGVGWAAGVPSLGIRGGLVVVALPDKYRGALWLGALTAGEGGGGVGPEAVQEAWLCQGSPVRSPAIGERVRCLFQDLRRTRIPAYCNGVGLDRVRRLLLLWLRREEENEYRQGLTFMACPLLDAFPSLHPPHLGWDPVSDGQALLCFSRMIEMHTDGLFVAGNSLDRLQQRLGLLDTLLMWIDPVTAVHLSSCSINAALYASRWLITLCSDVLPLDRTVALFDALFTLGRGFLPCFCAAIVIAHRDSILATTTQTNLLLFFSQLNSGADRVDHDYGAPRIDVASCISRALFLYQRMPRAFLRKWDSDQMGAEAAPRRKTTSEVDSRSLPPPAEPPAMLERPPEITEQDLAEMVADLKAAEPAAAVATAAGDAPPEEPKRRLGVLLLDVRPLEEQDRACPPGTPADCPRLQLPWTRLRGHVAFCQGRSVQQEMRPPPPLRPYVGHTHIIVCAGTGAHAEGRARGVARMLVLARVPFVSVLVVA